jgi:type I restriction enzyme M protein
MSKSTKKPKPKADIDFEQQLWDAANELRGAVAENQYKDYVLSLLFVRHISERYVERKEELVSLASEPTSEYYTKNKKDLEQLLNDDLEYQVKNVYRLPEEATWEYLRDNAAQDDIKVKVDKAFVLIDEILGQRNEDYKGVLQPIFVKSQLTNTQTAGLIRLFSKLEFSEMNNPESDVYGRVYEYYIGKFAMAEGSGAGQFFTPGSVVRLLVEMLEPLHGKIMDLACGSGGMFVQSLKFVKAHGGDKSDISIYGQERYDGTLRLCKMNLLLRNLSFDVKLGDSLLQDRFPNDKADFLMMNPPFNISKWHPEDLPDKDPRLFGPKETFTTDGNANYMWFQTIWHHLSTKGTAGVVMANGAMTTGSAGEKNVREYMIQNNMVDCIVQMPDKLFLTTGIPACLFILSKNRDGRDGEHRERKKEILFIDARKLGNMVSRRLRVFSEDDIHKVTNSYHQWRNKGGIYKDVEGFCKAATLEEVVNNNCVLSPGRYVGTEAEEDDGVSFEEKMRKLMRELAEQFEESEKLQLKIKNNLSSIGFSFGI